MVEGEPLPSEPGTDPAPVQARSSRASGIVPRPQIDPDKLDFVLVKPRRSEPERLPRVVEAYRCWKQVWESTFYELEGKTHVPSDDFTRQDEIGSIFLDDECIATLSMRWVDLTNPLFHEDSYFAAWSAEALAEAAREGTRICISSSFTVAEAWRGSRGFPLNDLLGILMLERFLSSDADTMVGTMRNDRGMNKFTYRFGFRPIQRDVQHHGVPVDLVAFHRSSSQRPRLEEHVERKALELLNKGDLHA